MPIIPKYYQVKSDIRQKIQNETFQVKQPLPSEKDLMEYYNVSRITIRKALDDLANEGYLFKIQGKGTFVGDPRKRGIDILHHTSSCISELKQRGYVTKRIVLNAKIVECDELLARQYGLCPGDRYFEFERIYTGDSASYSYEISYYLYRFVPGIENNDLENESIHSILKDLHFDQLQVTRMTEIQAILSEGNLCDVFQLPAGQPLLRMSFHSFLTSDPGKDEQQKCVESSLAFWRTDIIPVMIL